MAPFGRDVLKTSSTEVAGEMAFWLKAVEEGILLVPYNRLPTDICGKHAAGLASPEGLVQQGCEVLKLNKSEKGWTSSHRAQLNYGTKF